VSEGILGGKRCAKGSPFHTEGPTTENARAWVAKQRVTPVPMSGVNCDLWCPGWDSKDLESRPEQDSGYTSRPWHQYGIWSAAGGGASGVHSVDNVWI